ncbi:MAG: hypothetical protein Q9222_005775 [Ikaeria aurantiellina]
MKEQSLVRRVAEKQPEERDGLDLMPLVDIFESPRLDVVTVRVGSGSEERLWRLPKPLLTHASPFFRAAFCCHSKKSYRKEVHLEDESPSAFRFFLGWLFTTGISDPSDLDNDLVYDTPRFTYLLAWILGDKLACPRFQDFAMECLRASTNKRWFQDSALFFREAYFNTPAGSKLRRWAANQFLYYVRSCPQKLARNKSLIRLLDELDDFAADVLKIQITPDRPVERFLIGYP